LLLRLEAGKTEAERAFQFVQLRLPKAGEPVTRQTFSFWLDKRKFQQAERIICCAPISRRRPRTTLKIYMQLTLIESAFCCLKTDLTIRPLYQTFAVGRLEPHRPVLTPKAVLENLSAFN